MRRLTHCALAASHREGGRATRPRYRHCHRRRATKPCVGLLQLTESQAKNRAAQVTLSLQHTFGKRQELQQVQRNDTVGGITRSKRSRYAMSRRLWKEQYRDQDGNALTSPKRTTYRYADEGLIAEATQATTLHADGSVTASAPPAVTTQYGPRPDAPFTTGMLFIKTQNSKGQDTLAYYHHDHLGTPIQATDKTGRVVWAADYNAFGQAAIITPAATEEAPTIGSNLRLPGQYWDEETGLHYNWHRYYEPGTGRYIQSDPIGLAGGLNTFSYAEANPLMFTDPMGLQTRPWRPPGVPIPGLPSPRPLDPTDPYGPKITPVPSVPDWFKDLFKPKEECPTECTPPAGTVCYIIDLVPPSAPHLPIPGSHYHLWRHNQAAPGKCFWNPMGASQSAPLGAIPCPFKRPPRSK